MNRLNEARMCVAIRHADNLPAYFDELNFYPKNQFGHCVTNRNIAPIDITPVYARQLASKVTEMDCVWMRSR